MSTIATGNTLTTGLVQTSDTTGNLVFQTNGTTTALTLATNQNATLANNVSVVGSVSSVNTFGFKNRIINGNMVIDQRNAGAATANTISGYTLDRWYVQQSTTGKLIVQQNAGSVTPPTSYTKYLGITSQSAYTVAAGDWYTLFQVIEGNNIADFAWGTASAKTVTLSFQVYSSLTGTFGGSLRNQAGNRSYPFSYSIPVANTWTTISVTIAGDTSGTWVTDNTGGIWVYFGLGVGTTYSSTSGAWAAGNYFSATGATSVVGTNGATFYITGVQLEVGLQATSFDFRSSTNELALCQRYYYKQSGATSYQRFGMGFVGAGSTTAFYATVIFPVTMRAKPTSIDWTGNIGVWNGGAIAAVSVISLESGSESTTSAVALSTSSGLTAQSPYILIGNASSTAALAFSAEL
jgi:hypothetical protein